MASPAADGDVPDAPRHETDPAAEPSHPEPACQEAQKWIEVSEVTAGACSCCKIGDIDVRNGGSFVDILLRRGYK